MIRYSGYSNLIELNRPGIYALVHVRTKSMYLSYSNNILTSVSTHLASAKNGTNANPHLNKHYKNLRLYIIEFCDSNILRTQYGYWYNKLKPVYNRVPPVQYKVRIRVDHEYLVRVELVNRNRDVLVLGIFNKMSDANEFALKVNSQAILRPLYCDNELTRKYLDENKY